MPGGNGTGPMGLGPKTGRAAGFCAGFSVPGYMNPMRGMGFGFGAGRGGRPYGGGRGRAWGGGRGWRWRANFYNDPYHPYFETIPEMYNQNMSPQDEIKFQKDQISILQEQIKTTQERIKELESEAVKQKKE